MRLTFSPLAAADIEDIGDFIHRDSPAAALRFVADLRARCYRILDAPKGGSPRPQLGLSVRAIPFQRYVIYYETEGDTVAVLRVLHSARDVGTAFGGE